MVFTIAICLDSDSDIALLGSQHHWIYQSSKEVSESNQGNHKLCKCTRRGDSQYLHGRYLYKDSTWLRRFFSFEGFITKQSLSSMAFRSELVHSHQMKLSGIWNERWKICTLLHLVGSLWPFHGILVVLNMAVRGDKIKALKQLRPSPSFKSHHFSTFRSGLLLGFAIPALIDGLMKGQYLWIVRSQE